MKEIKTFFADDIALNKGYATVSQDRYKPHDNKVYYQKKLANLLPPAEVVSEYEEIYPGILKRMMDMVEQDQQHNQALSLTNLELYNHNTKRGQNIALLSLVIICITTVLLGVFQSGMISFIFFASALLTIIVAIITTHCSATKKPKNK
jgi:uncharacterized membrane protein